MPRKKLLSEWIPAYDALKMLYPHLGGYHGTKILLAELSKDGDLDARVREAWDSKRSSLTTISLAAISAVSSGITSNVVRCISRIATMRPVAVVGDRSPYPTVVAVTTDHQAELQKSLPSAKSNTAAAASRAPMYASLLHDDRAISDTTARYHVSDSYLDDIAAA